MEKLTVKRLVFVCLDRVIFHNNTSVSMIEYEALGDKNIISRMLLLLIIIMMIKNIIIKNNKICI